MHRFARGFGMESNDNIKAGLNLINLGRHVSKRWLATI
jgi:hypothetical protein